MPRVPIIRLSDRLIATVQDDLRDRDAEQLQSDLGMQVERTGARGVLLDLSVVETLDTEKGVPLLRRLMADAGPPRAG